MLAIRTAQPDDAPEIARLNKLFNGVDEPAANYSRRLGDSHRVDMPILAEIDGRVIGLANLRLLPTVFYSEMYAELTELFVEEDFRRRGAGRALVSYAERLALDGGAHEMIILTDFYNDTAQALYRSLGYAHRDIALSKNLGQEN
jgi:GNAT superfamily N-acetyltransferase